MKDHGLVGEFNKRLGKSESEGSETSTETWARGLMGRHVYCSSQRTSNKNKCLHLYSVLIEWKCQLQRTGEKKSRKWRWFEGYLYSIFDFTLRTLLKFRRVVVASWFEMRVDLSFACGGVSDPGGLGSIIPLWLVPSTRTATSSILSLNHKRAAARLAQHFGMDVVVCMLFLNQPKYHIVGPQQHCVCP